MRREPGDVSCTDDIVLCNDHVRICVCVCVCEKYLLLCYRNYPMPHKVFTISHYVINVAYAICLDGHAFSRCFVLEHLEHVNRAACGSVQSQQTTQDERVVLTTPQRLENTVVKCMGGPQTQRIHRSMFTILDLLDQPTHCLSQLTRLAFVKDELPKVT